MRKQRLARDDIARCGEWHEQGPAQDHEERCCFLQRMAVILERSTRLRLWEFWDSAELTMESWGHFEKAERRDNESCVRRFSGIVCKNESSDRKSSE